MNNLPRISVVIPTYNEEKNIGKILQYLGEQTLQAHEIIIGDNSTDKTAEIAKAAGAIVTDGRTVGAGRNHAGQKATGEILLFLDCDVRFKKDFLEKALQEFLNKKLTIALIQFNYDSKHLFDLAFGGAMNYGTQLIQYFYPFTHGFSIMCSKEVFNKVKGFDETLKLGEDVDFGQRASKHGKFRVITSTKVWISPRRLKEEGRLNLVWKLIKSTFKIMLGGKIKYDDPNFEHKFGEHKE